MIVPDILEAQIQPFQAMAWVLVVRVLWMPGRVPKNLVTPELRSKRSTNLITSGSL